MEPSMDTRRRLRYGTPPCGHDGACGRGVARLATVHKVKHRRARRLERGRLTLLDVIVIAGLLCLLLAAAAGEFRHYEGRATVSPSAVQPPSPSASD